MLRSRNNVRLASLIAALAALLLVSGALAEPKDDAQAAMKGTIDEVLAVLRVPGSAELARRKQIEDIAKQRFDFTTMSKLVLKRDWFAVSRSVLRTTRSIGDL